MIMVNLIGILLIGGLLAMISERFGDTMPRKVHGRGTDRFALSPGLSFWHA